MGLLLFFTCLWLNPEMVLEATMRKPAILLVDNDPRLLASSSDYLEREGFHVLKDGSGQEALLHAQAEVIHLAVIDIRLVDDRNEEDYSGLHLAADLPVHITKIILTGQWFANPADLVRRVLEPDDQGNVLAAKFLWKSEGPEKDLEAIQKVLRTSIKNNFNLEIKHLATATWRALVNQISLFSNCDVEAKRKAELVLEDLSCSLFHKASKISFIRSTPGNGSCTVAL